MKAMKAMLLEHVMTYQRACNKMNTTDVTCETGTDQMSSRPVFSGVCVARSLVFCVVFCRLMCVFCPFSFGRCIICPSIYCF